MEKTRKVAFITLGCKVNTSETEGMKQLFIHAGYSVVSDDEFADVYVINTCTVTSMGDKKSRQMLRRAHSLNPDAVVAAVGCFAQVAPEEAAKIEGVNLVVGTNMKNRIVELVEHTRPDEKQIYVMERKALSEYEELPVDNYEGHTRAFLKIQDGCDQFCSYCIIPYARGPVRSRGIGDVVEEAKRFAFRGFKEVVLTGIHLTSYGDKTEGSGLLDLISRVHDIEGIERIRLGSLEPMFLNPEFVQGIRHLPKLCPHFHISLQSGAEATLKRMNRKYRPKDYRAIVRMLKQEIPDVAVTTDVMVGFPGETHEEFEESYGFCEEMGFQWIHVFKYSPRQGTPAARYPSQVPPAVKEERSKRLIALAEKMREAYFRAYLDTEISVLLEQEVNGMMEGLTPNYIPVRALINSDKAGEIIKVRLKGIEKDHMLGSPTE
ncbi:MAG: tRNA (N(6)-L-threonylcarbamoyladenosine(37)-C(2))-methylthiotransferase MtaB [Clostridia bacterium]|nr:tRNA (N(6)-L-threonylcarbamoyladenosine(37)-C(2))-methylthiotransferase MtaB [Clostridia bacterium]